MRNAQKALWLLRNGHHRPLLRGIPPPIPVRRTYTDQYGTLSNRCSRELFQTRATQEPAPSANRLRGNVDSLGDPAAREREALTDHEAALVTREEHGEHRVFAGRAKALSRHFAP